MARSVEPTVIGLDLSLTGTGIVVIPPGWDLTWGKLKCFTVGHGVEGEDTQKQIERLILIENSIARLIDTVNDPRGVRGTHVFIEEYAYNMATSSRAHRIGELGGVVKRRIYKGGIVPVSIVNTTARKFLLGKLPRKDAKKVVKQALHYMGARFGSDDEGDAFVVANYGRSELGLKALTIAGMDHNPG